MTCYARAASNDMVDGLGPKVHPAETERQGHSGRAMRRRKESTGCTQTSEEAGSILTG